MLTLPRLVDTLPRLVFVFDNVVETTDRFESVVDSDDEETLVRAGRHVTQTTTDGGLWLVLTLPRLVLMPT